MRRCATANAVDGAPPRNRKSAMCPADATGINHSGNFRFARNCADFFRACDRKNKTRRVAAAGFRFGFGVFESDWLGGRRGLGKPALRMSKRRRRVQWPSSSSSSAYSSGDSSSLSWSRLSGCTTNTQPSPNASSLIVSGLSESASLTATTLPDTGL